MAAPTPWSASARIHGAQRAEWPGKNESAEGEGEGGKGRRRERRGLFFRERPRTEVARGGAPSVGGPPVELKLMDKGRRASQFSSN